MLKQDGTSTTRRSTTWQSADSDADDSAVGPRATTTSARTTRVSESAITSHGQNVTGISGEYGSAAQDPPECGEENRCRDRSELKGIPKPEKFSGLSGTWDSWYYKFKTWVESCHKNAIQVIQKLESTVDVAITERSLEDDFPDGAELVSAQARQALISLTEGEALEIVKNTSRGTHFGLEALRRLLSKYDPQNPQANSALLKKVLHPQQCSLDKLREGLESWENLKRKYEERRKKQLEDDICRSCLQQMCPNKLQDHLDLQASRLPDYMIP